MNNAMLEGLVRDPVRPVKKPAGSDEMMEGLAPITDEVAPQSTPQPEPPASKAAWYERAADTVTGHLRQTGATKALPELSNLLDPSMPETQKYKAALGLLTTFDEDRQKAILQEVDPSIAFTKDEKGNEIISKNGHDVAILNKPGLSKIDLMRMAGQAGLFSPGTHAAAGLATIKARGAAVAGASGLTQVLQDLFNQALGGTGEVTAGNINKTEAAAATAGGAIFEWGAGLLARRFPRFFAKGDSVDVPAVKRTMVEAAKEHGIDPSQITDDLVDQSIAAAKKATGQGDDAAKPLAQAVRDTDEFGIEYTLGQRTGNQRQVNWEDSARHGGLGDRPQTALTTYAKETQAPQIADAVEGVQKNIGGELLERVDDVAGVADVIREGAESLEKRVSQAYSQVGDAVLSPEGFNKLINATRKAVIGPDFDRTLPETAKFMALLKDKQKLFNLTVMGAGGKPVKVTMKPVHIKQIEAMRRRLGTSIASAEKADKRQLVLMKQQFDNYLDEAVTQALFSGDDAALDSMKAARSLRTEYAKKYQAKPVRDKSGRKINDKAGQFIEEIIAANPTSQQISNALFGSGATFGNASGVKLARRIKDVAGPEGWDTIRQAAFMKLARIPEGQGTISGQKMLTSLDKAMSQHGAKDGLMKALFSDAEIGQMYRLANAIKRAQPEKQNPSGTSYKAANLVSQVWDGITTSLGVASGNPAPIIARGALKIAGGSRKNAKANEAIRPLKEVAKQKGVLVGAAESGLVPLFPVAVSNPEPAQSQK